MTMRPNTATTRALGIFLAAGIFLAQGCGSGRRFGGESGVLALLGITPSEESVDYVGTKTQFQLHTLLTEQRHRKTWDLSQRIGEDTLAGLRMLSSVDDDIRDTFEAMAAAGTADLDRAVASVEEAILAGRKIYIYGCGATGRLAKQMESAFWRPFWKKVKSDEGVWRKLGPRLGEGIEDGLIGEMTGADRALISSLEGFEDLLLIGRLQLEDRGVAKGDVVICVTEGGETSSVIGTILAARDQWLSAGDRDPERSRGHLFFVYNNPDDRLLPFERSRRVLDEPGITKINLTTGPQSITGSTRMQATTSETYVVGTILEAAVEKALRRHLTREEMARLGFGGEISIPERLREFGSVLEAAKAALPSLARLTDLESRAYSEGRFSTYFAADGLITVFIDSTERSPTFRLFPLDTVNEPERKCWIQVWAPAETVPDAWRVFLGRPFRGLDQDFYRKPFEEEIDDPYLRRAALESLTKAGNDQQDLYDFSFSEWNTTSRGPKTGDLGVLVCLTPEEPELGRRDSYFRRFLDSLAAAGASAAVLLVTDMGRGEIAGIEESLRNAAGGRADRLLLVPVQVPAAGDPFGIRQQIAAKMLLNAHSTAVMAKLGKVIGNTMTNVSPSNLKLIGRATFLILSHVNDRLGRPEWTEAYGRQPSLTYAEANAVLFDAIAFLKDKSREAGQTAEVAFSIIRILESFRTGRALGSDETLEIVRTVGLSSYLAGL
jgi:N-acetylmuramic acid 6-phosphate (MurNAc-6-P) etherase